MHKTMNETSNNILNLLKRNQEFFNVTKDEENMEAMKKQEIGRASCRERVSSPV